MINCETKQEFCSKNTTVKQNKNIVLKTWLEILLISLMLWRHQRNKSQIHFVCNCRQWISHFHRDLLPSILIWHLQFVVETGNSYSQTPLSGLACGQTFLAAVVWSLLLANLVLGPLAQPQEYWGSYHSFCNFQAWNDITNMVWILKII